MTQLKFNQDGTISLPEEIKKDIANQKQKQRRESLDIWEQPEEPEKFDEQVYNVKDDVNKFNLYNKGKKLEPLKFSNNKTQEDVVDEVIEKIEQGEKAIFIRGVCGTGKCLDKNTRILCKPNDKKYLGYYKISQLVGKKGDIYSINNQGKIIEDNFSNVRNTGKKKLYRLITRTGRRVIASENHPFLTITKNGLEWLPLNKLRDSSYICIPNKLNLKQKCNLDDNEIKILAHLIAEGKLGDFVGSPVYFQDKKINYFVRKDYEDALKKVFPDGEIKSYFGKDVVIIFKNMDTSHGTTNKLRLFIRKFGLDGKKSSEKFIPKIIFNLNDIKVSLFLKILFSCDGSIYIRKNKKSIKQVIVEYDSISKLLIEDVSLLLNRFGIQHTITSKKFRENLNYSWRISISNQAQIKKFIENIGFIGRKQEFALKLYEKCKDHKFTNIDKVPRVIRDYLKREGYAYNELDRFLNYESIEELRKTIGFKRIRKEKLTEAPCVFKQGKIDFLRQHLVKVNEHISDKVISFICNNQIMWDKIKSIEYFKEDETYDLEVSKYHNFIANGIIVHNSAIALNIAKQLGDASIIVPGKALQKQYWKDYSHDSYVLKRDYKKLKIKVITGRQNHKCLCNTQCSADDSELPCKIEIKEANIGKLREYLRENPKVKNDLELKNIRRISVAPICPYYSPIVPSEFDLNLSAQKRNYTGLNKINFTIYNRKAGCTYYNQFNSYIDAEAIIFNSAKYKLEVLMNRKPETKVEIIDECDEFLDSFSNIMRINLNRLSNALNHIFPDDETASYVLDKISKCAIDILKDPEVKDSALSDEILHIQDTQIHELLKYFTENKKFITSVDEDNYCQTAYETAKAFEDYFEDSYVKFSQEERGLVASIVTTNLAKKFKELSDKSKVIVMMSGTIHDENVLKNIFGLENFTIIDAETINQGEIEVMKTGLEID